MYIEKINIPKDFINDGLGDIEMNRLNNVVVIAGKNGSGKSRLLKKIEKAVNDRPNEAQIKEIKQNIEVYTERIKSLNDQLSTNDNEIEIIEKFNNSINDGKESINQYNISLDILNYITFSENLFKYQAVNIVPKETILKDSGNISLNELKELHNMCQTIGVEKLEDNVFSYIQLEQNRWFSATHQNSNVEENKKKEVIMSYKKLCELINKFLGATLGRTIDDICTIFGIELGKSGLSDGQKILLQLCVAIHAQEVSLNNVILIMDEPENHLHPSALIDFISKVLEILRNGQVWIATHSISLLSFLNNNDSSIFYMEDGKVSYAGKTPEKVLEGLIGNQERVSKLQDFLLLPASLASINFAYECLFAPKAVKTAPTDKQTSQIRNTLLGLDKKNKIRVLDYGAGKGRLLEAIYFSDEISDKEGIKEWLDYIAFDEFDEDKKICKEAISIVYGTSERRYFNKENLLAGAIDDNSCDVVVMCNVLHEIPSDKWVSLFKKDSIINTKLKETGFLLIVEDLLIPVGEKPHKNGFLILGETQLKKLFYIQENDIDFKYTYADEEERLLACSIPQKYISRITEESYKATLNSLKNLAKSEILSLRDKTDYKSGRLHALWSQQLANIILISDI